MLINTATDLSAAAAGPERDAFLLALLNDFVTFDNAVYPEGYDRELQESEAGYVAPMLRQEWNAGAAAAWGFTSREQIEEAISTSNPNHASA